MNTMRSSHASAARVPATITAAVTALVLVAVMAFAATSAPARSMPGSFADLAEKLLPSVVNISTSQVVRGRRGQEVPRLPPGSPFEEFFKEFFDRQGRRDAPRRRATSLGSGFVIDASGLIVTNNHVIAEADEIVVILQDGTRLKAKVVGRDTKTDIAVLRVDASKPLTAVEFGDSDTTRVGDWVLAIGNPFGLGGSVSAGIVSAHHRNINAGPYDDFIQTDAPINRGNSGGPLFNMEGQVIGINTAIFSPSGGSVGIGFSIPSNLAKPVIDQLREFGRTRRGWLGVRIQSVTDEIAQGLALDRARGALVAKVFEDDPADKAKIEVGDVILRFDGKDIEQSRHLSRAVAETAPGKDVEVEIWRKGNRIVRQVVLGELPEDIRVSSTTDESRQRQERHVTVSVLGLKLAAISPELRARFKLDDGIKGVVITGVAEGSPASNQVRPGDIIRNVGPNLEVVTTPAQVKDKVDHARENSMKRIVLLIVSGQDSRFVSLLLAVANDDGEGKDESKDKG